MKAMLLHYMVRLSACIFLQRITCAKGDYSVLMLLRCMLPLCFWPAEPHRCCYWRHSRTRGSHSACSGWWCAGWQVHQREDSELHQRVPVPAVCRSYCLHHVLRAGTCCALGGVLGAGHPVKLGVRLECVGLCGHLLGSTRIPGCVSCCMCHH